MSTDKKLKANGTGKLLLGDSVEINQSTGAATFSGAVTLDQGTTTTLTTVGDQASATLTVGQHDFYNAANLIGRIRFDTDGATNSGRMFLFTANTSGSLSNFMMMNDDGNVGIGTASPNAKLEVADTANDLQMRIGTLTAGIDPFIRLQGRNVADSANRFADIQLDADNALFLIKAPNTTSPSITGFSMGSSGAVTLGPSGGLPTSTAHDAYGSATAANPVFNFRKPTGSDSSSTYYLYCKAGASGTTDQGGLWNNASGNFETFTVSDISLKENIRDSERGLSELLQLKPRKYDWRSGTVKDVEGFIAQEFETVLPEHVGETTDGTKHVSFGPGYQAMLVKAIQELAAKVEALEAAAE